MGKHVAEITTVDGVWVAHERTRRWLYGIAAALVPLLITLDVLTQDIADGVLSVIAAVLAVGSSALAGVNATDMMVITEQEEPGEPVLVDEP